MLKALFKSVVVTLALALVLCGAYPLFVSAVARIFFPWQAEGSLVTLDGKIVGSRLIGQNFSRPEYFHSRPSAAGEKGYDGAASSGSNLGPTSRKLVEATRVNIERVRRENPDVALGKIPVDLATVSGSGLDPHVSIEGARVQIARVARARHAEAARVEAIVSRHTTQRPLGLFGEPVVNVLEANLDLDRSIPVK